MASKVVETRCAGIQPRQPIDAEMEKCLLSQSLLVSRIVHNGFLGTCTGSERRSSEWVGRIKGGMQAVLDDLGELSVEGLGKAFVSAARTGELPTLQAILNCDRFREIPAGNHGVGDALVGAVEYGRLEALQAILNCNRFQEIPVGKHGLGDALVGAVEFSHLEELKEILNCNRFGEVLVDCTISALVSASKFKYDRPQAFQAIINTCGYYGELPFTVRNALERGFQRHLPEAKGKKLEDILKMLSSDSPQSVSGSTAFVSSLSAPSRAASSQIIHENPSAIEPLASASIPASGPQAASGSTAFVSSLSAPARAASSQAVQEDARKLRPPASASIPASGPQAASGSTAFVSTAGSPSMR